MTELYSVWCEYKNRPPSWFWLDGVVWFTPDVRVAHAQCSLLSSRFVEYEYSKGTITSVIVRRLGSNGEPLELGDDEMAG